MSKVMTDTELQALHLSVRNPFRPGRITGAPRHLPPPLPARLLLALERCVEVVGAEMRVSRDSILSHVRFQHIVQARAIAMYVARRVAREIYPAGYLTQRSNSSYPTLARFFQRDHSTIVYHVGKVTRHCARSHEFAVMIEKLVIEARQ